MKIIAQARYLVMTALISLSLIAGHAFARPQPLQITLFVHQDVTQSVDKLHQDFFSHWEKEMTEISGREVQFDYVTEANEITTLDYRNDNHDAVLRQMQHLARRYFADNEKPGRAELNKSLLLTTRPLNDVAYGITTHLSNTGIASLDYYSAPAHELGHMFGAIHDHAKSGWSMCDSYMANRNALKAHCYTFSEANRDLIGDHLIQFP